MDQEIQDFRKRLIAVVERRVAVSAGTFKGRRIAAFRQLIEHAERLSSSDHRSLEISMREMSYGIDATETTVRRGIDDLVAMGVLIITRHGGGYYRPHRYSIAEDVVAEAKEMQDA